MDPRAVDTMSLDELSSTMRAMKKRQKPGSGSTMSEEKYDKMVASIQALPWVKKRVQ